MQRPRGVLAVVVATLACMPSSPSATPLDLLVIPALAPLLPLAQPAPGPLGARRLDDRALAANRGGADALSVMKLKGLVADNQAINVVTGNNTISEGAFSGAAGLPMVIQNSGNNVLIQNATIVNVHVK